MIINAAYAEHQQKKKMETTIKTNKEPMIGAIKVYDDLPSCPYCRYPCRHIQIYIEHIEKHLIHDKEDHE